VDVFVPVVSSAAPGSVNYTAGSTCHGSQMPHFTVPRPPCQQSPKSSSSATVSVNRSQSAPLLVKQRKCKGATERCSSSVQTCGLHSAQANFRKSLRRGFLSPLAAQGGGVAHFTHCVTGGGHPAGSQVMPFIV